MIKEDSFIDDGNSKEFMFTYSEEERQSNEINRENARLVFSPKFIPVYPELLKRGLTVTEALLFGFIDFYKSSASTRFYFTNDQLAKIIECSPDTVSRGISKLESLGLIKTSRRIKAGGGSIRFVTDISYKSDSTKTTTHTRQKLQTNNNKINKNNNTGFLEKPAGRRNTSFNREDYSRVLEEYQSLKGIKLKGEEFKPAQQTIKTMFMSDRSADDIIYAMRWLDGSGKEWTEQWTLNTVKMKIPNILAERDKVVAKKESKKFDPTGVEFI